MIEAANPYQTPDSELNEDLNKGEVSASNPMYFTASSFKLIIMSVVTFGIYEYYWFYKNFKIIKERENSNIMPFWRAFFAPLWAYSCFKKINESAVAMDRASLPVGPLHRLPDVFWFISFFTFIILLPVNSEALKLNSNLTPDYIENNRFSVWNIIGIVFGVLLFVLAGIGTYVENNPNMNF